MARFQGTITLSGLPPHRGIILNVCFYKVSGFEAPPPHGGAPPASAAVDIHRIFEDVHLEEESRQTRIEQPFELDHEEGYFYVEVRPILFRERDAAMLAQAEQFFFERRPVRITHAPEGPVTFPITWPSEDLNRLHRYGTIKPRGNEPLVATTKAIGPVPMTIVIALLVVGAIGLVAFLIRQAL